MKAMEQTGKNDRPFRRLCEYRGKRVLVTGASGVLGSVLCGMLVQVRAKVVAFTRRAADWSRRMRLLGFEQMSNATTVAVDLTEYDRLAEIVDQHRPEVVFHLASQAIVSACERRPAAAWRANASGSFNLADTVRRARVSPIVVASTSDKAYGDAPRPYREDGPLCGGRDGSVYELTKLVQEQVFTWLNAFVPTVRLRCCNLVGFDTHFSRIIPATLLRLRQGLVPQVYRDAALNTRTYIDVRDAAGAFLLAGLNGHRSAVRGEAFNVANPACAFTTQEVIRKVAEAFGVPVEFDPDIVERPAGLPSHIEIPDQTLDIRRIRERLGWTPHYAFDKTLDYTVRLFRRYFGLREFADMPTPVTSQAS